MPAAVVHRRSSSWWIPPHPPIIDRIEDSLRPPDLKKCVPTFIQNRIPQLATPSDRARSCSLTIDECRSIEPNWLSRNAQLPRYRLPNFKQYCSNKISTKKYSLVTFLPLNLFEQFHRFANLYFLLIVSLNWIPQLEAVSKFVGMIPVVVILGCTALKDFVEDWRRRMADYKLNRSSVHAWDSQKRRFRRTRWEHLLVGDLVHLSCDQQIPADILVLRSSDPHGSVFVETSNLDGESNLKQRMVLPNCRAFCGSNPERKPDPENIRLQKIDCVLPNHKLKNIFGTAQYADDSSVDAITYENVLLRGCRIRNTSFVEGVVLYTGDDTKLMLSSGNVRYKRSSVERTTNHFIGCYVGILAFLVISSGVGSTLWLLSFSNDSAVPFVLQTASSIGDGLVNFAEFIICYQTLIPLSLYITVEMIRIGQCYLLANDIELYDEESDKPVLCRSLNIPEELGQIQYILSDKTGTLTDNKMVFRACSVRGSGFDHPENEEESVNEDLQARLDDAINSMSEDHELPIDEHSDFFYFFLTASVCNTVMVRRESEQGIDEMEMGYTDAQHSDIFHVGNSVFYDTAMSPLPTPKEELRQATPSAISIDLASRSPCHLSPAENSTARHFNFSLKRDELMRRLSTKSLKSFFGKAKSDLQAKLDGSKSEGRPMYDGESPDELCLVKMAYEYGMVLDKRTLDEVDIRINDHVLEYEILKVLPFDSVRKRMSAYVRMKGKEGNVLLLCKGADEAIMDLLDQEQHGNALNSMKRLLQKYSTDGLRTLCIAMRIISTEEFTAWLLERELAEAAALNSGDESQLARNANTIERKLRLLGVTAIEDKLQEGVGETIDSLRQAGIQLWVLTGDKLETALNIASSSHLFEKETDLMLIQSMEDLQVAHGRISGDANVNFNLVLSSEGVNMLRKGQEEMIELIQKTKAVLCFRLTPAEKADVVCAVKKCSDNKGHVGKVLAIGDGANDVPMLLTADVGVGIYGREGLQAMMAADFAISRFRFLRRLLLVHGHWNYHRLAGIILYLLDKNAIFVFIFYWAQFFSGFGGFAPVDPFYSMFYPIVFTSVQPFLYGMLDQDFPAEMLLAYPELYASGQDGKVYTAKNFVWNVVDGIYQSAAIYFTAHLSYWDSTAEIWEFSFFLSTAMFFANQLHLALITNSWTWTILLSQLFFATLHFGFFLGYGEVCMSVPVHGSPPVGVFQHAMLDPLFWTGVLLAVLIALTPRFCHKIFTPQLQISSDMQGHRPPKLNTGLKTA